MKRSFGAGL